MNRLFPATPVVPARSACAVVLATLAMTCNAAPSYPKEGKYDYAACYSGTTTVIQVSKTSYASTSKFVGNTRSNPPGGPFDTLAYSCVNMSSTHDSKTTSSYFCQVTDMDGDKFMAHGVFDGTKTTTDAFGGTEGARIKDSRCLVGKVD